MFLRSFDTTVSHFRTRVAEARAGRRLDLPNLNLDTGRPWKPGDYRLADETYAKWREKRAKALQEDGSAGGTQVKQED